MLVTYSSPFRHLAVTRFLRRGEQVGPECLAGGGQPTRGKVGEDAGSSAVAQPVDTEWRAGRLTLSDPAVLPPGTGASWRRNRHHVLAPSEHPGQRHLRWSGVVSVAIEQNWFTSSRSVVRLPACQRGW